MAEANLKRLGEYVKKRRLVLNMFQDDVTKAGGPSDKKQSLIERGRGPVPSLTTLAKYDEALGWTRGSACAVMYGGEPTIAIVEDTPARTELEHKRTELEQALARHGVSEHAARQHSIVPGGLVFDPEAVGQLIELLNSIHPPSSANEPGAAESAAQTNS